MLVNPAVKQVAHGTGRADLRMCGSERVADAVRAALRMISAMRSGAADTAIVSLVAVSRVVVGLSLKVAGWRNARIRRLRHATFCPVVRRVLVENRPTVFGEPDEPRTELGHRASTRLVLKCERKTHGSVASVGKDSGVRQAEEVQIAPQALRVGKERSAWQQHGFGRHASQLNNVSIGSICRQECSFLFSSHLGFV